MTFILGFVLIGTPAVVPELKPSGGCSVWIDFVILGLNQTIYRLNIRSNIRPHLLAFGANRILSKIPNNWQ